MGNIVCLDKDYQIHKVYDNLDLLLEEIKGSKTQAQKALEDPTLSFRGFKLVEQEKLPNVYSNLYHEKVESLRNEYGGTIEDLENKLKESTKTERKAKFRVDELEDDYSAKYTETKEAYEKEQNRLKNLHNSEKETLDDMYKKYIEDLKNQHVDSINDLKKQAKSSDEDIIKVYTEHTKALNETISEYISEQAKQKAEHEKAVTELSKAYDAKINAIFVNINNLNAYLENKRKQMLNKVSSLMEVMTTMVKGDKKVYLLDSDTLPTLKEDIKVSDVNDSNKYAFDKDTKEIKLDDYLPNTLKSIEKVGSEGLPKEPAILTEKKIVEKELPKLAEATVKESAVKIPETPIKNPEPVKEEIKAPEPVSVKGILLKDKSDYAALTTGAKGFYLSNLMLKGLTVSDLDYFETVLEDINGEVADVIISELVAHKKTYSAYADFLKELNLERILNNLNIEQKEKDAFLEKEQEPEAELKDVTPSNPSDYATEKKTTSEQGLPKGAINFNWGKYIEILNQNVDMEELLDKDTLTMRDLQTVIDVPSKQILGMLGVLKNLGYQKDFSNERVVSKLETILLIVVASSHSSQQGKESLEDLINKLYPSWVQFRAKNKM